jgi:hypothetical protein
MDGPTYDWVSAPIFSPDSKKIAYVVQKDSKNLVVINGNEEKLYDRILITGDKHLNFNSKNRLFYVAMDRNKIYYIEKSIQ